MMVFISHCRFCHFWCCFIHVFWFNQPFIATLEPLWSHRQLVKMIPDHHHMQLKMIPEHHHADTQPKMIPEHRHVITWKIPPTKSPLKPTQRKVSVPVPELIFHSFTFCMLTRWYSTILANYPRILCGLYPWFSSCFFFAWFIYLQLG